MDGDFIVWLFVVGFWLISGLLNKLGRRFQPPELPPEIDPAFSEGVPTDGSTPPPAIPSQDPRRRRAEKMARALQEMVDSVEDLGVPPSERTYREQGVPSEHEATGSEHRRTAGEHRRTAGEHRRVRGEHRRTAAEHMQAENERLRTRSEHRRTASEHRRGDYVGGPKVPLPPPPGTRRRRSSGRKRLALEGRAELRRAILLKEVLGPPVSMRNDSGDDSF